MAKTKKGHMLDQQQIEYLTKEHEIKNNIVGTGFSTLLIPDRSTRVNFIGQIMRAEGFETAKVSIDYKLILPNNWEVEMPPSHLDDEDIDHEEYNRLSSTTQHAKGKITLNKMTGLYEYVYNLGFQLDFQLICKDSNFDRRGPVLIMQIFNDDTWGRYTLEGYAFCEFPRTPGRNVLECASWKPYESLSSQIFSFFVGGGIKVSDLSEVAATLMKTGEDVGTVLNRYTSKTVSSGRVFVEINMCTQSM